MRRNSLSVVNVSRRFLRRYVAPIATGERCCSTSTTQSSPLTHPQTFDAFIEFLQQRGMHVTSAAPSGGAAGSSSAATTGGGLPSSVLRSIVKIFATTSQPNCIIPWQMRQQMNVSGSGFVMSLEKRLVITNAHVVQNAQFVELRKHGDSNNHTGFVVFLAADCDVALVHVPDDSFWDEEGLIPLRFDTGHRSGSLMEEVRSAPSVPSTEHKCSAVEQLADLHECGSPFDGLPALQDSVKVAGYPVGGDQISITSGVVSRIDVGSYGSNTHSPLLTVQIDAAINHGNSGGPALHGTSHRVVGIAFQVLGNAESIGYIIPVPVVAAVMARFRRSTVMGLIHAAVGHRLPHSDGDSPAALALEAQQKLTSTDSRCYSAHMPSLGIYYQVLMNKHLRAYHGLNASQTGIRVSEIALRSLSNGQLKIGDILLSINGYKIENDGTVEFRPRERVQFSHIAAMTPLGKKVSLGVLRSRDKKSTGSDSTNEEITVDVEPSVAAPLVRVHLMNDEHRERPKYCMIGGIVVSTLTSNLLAEWGENWYNVAPRWLLNAYQAQTVTDDVDEIVVVVQVIPHPVNQSYDFLYARIVKLVDDVPVKNFDHFKALISERRSRALSSEHKGQQDVVVLRAVAHGLITTDAVLPLRDAIAADEAIAQQYLMPPQNW